MSEALLSLAIELSNSGKHRGASIILNELAAITPTKAILLNQAIVLMRQGLITDALEVFSQASTHFPQDGEILGAFSTLAAKHPDVPVSDTARRHIESLPIIQFLAVYEENPERGVALLSDLQRSGAPPSELLRCIEHARLSNPWHLPELPVDEILPGIDSSWASIIKSLYSQLPLAAPTMRAIAELCPSAISTLYQLCWRNGIHSPDRVQVAGFEYPYRVSIVAFSGVALVVKCVWYSDPSYMALTCQEHVALSRLSGLAVPQYVDHIEQETTYGIVMSQVLGVPLSQANLVEIDDVFVDVQSLLAAVHARGVSHGDISLRNILVSEFGVGLVDFGSAYVMPPDSFTPDYSALDTVIQHFKRNCTRQMDTSTKPTPDLHSDN